MPTVSFARPGGGLTAARAAAPECSCRPGGRPSSHSRDFSPPGAGLPVLRSRLPPVQGPRGPLPQPGALSAQPVLSLRHPRGRLSAQPVLGCPLRPPAPKRHLTAACLLRARASTRRPQNTIPLLLEGPALAVAHLALRSLRKSPVGFWGNRNRGRRCPSLEAARRQNAMRLRNAGGGQRRGAPFPPTPHGAHTGLARVPAGPRSPRQAPRGAERARWQPSRARPLPAAPVSLTCGSTPAVTPRLGTGAACMGVYL